MSAGFSVMIFVFKRSGFIRIVFSEKPVLNGLLVPVFHGHPGPNLPTEHTKPKLFWDCRIFSVIPIFF